MASNENCIFCKIIRGDIPSKKVFENDKILGFLDIFPMSPGHTIVAPKSHVNFFEDVEKTEVCEIFNIVQDLASDYLKKLNIDGYNILVNSHSAAGQEIQHFHVHIIPRKMADGIIRHKIPKNQATSEELEQILKEISS